MKWLCILCQPLATVSLTPSKFNNCVSLQAISRFNIANFVPPGGQTTFAEIAKQTGLEEQAIRRVLRHAMTMRVFREPEPGVVAHTQASKTLVNPVANDWMGCGTDEMWPAATKVRPIASCLTWKSQQGAHELNFKMIDALQKWPGTQEPNKTVRPTSSHGFHKRNRVECH